MTVIIGNRPSKTILAFIPTTRLAFFQLYVFDRFLAESMSELDLSLNVCVVLVKHLFMDDIKFRFDTAAHLPKVLNRGPILIF